MTYQKLWAVRNTIFPYLVYVVDWKPEKDERGKWKLEKPNRDSLMIVLSGEGFRYITGHTLDPGEGPVLMKLVPIEK